MVFGQHFIFNQRFRNRQEPTMKHLIAALLLLAATAAQAGIFMAEDDDVPYDTDGIFMAE